MLHLGGFVLKTIRNWLVLCCLLLPLLTACSGDNSSDIPSGLSNPEPGAIKAEKSGNADPLPRCESVADYGDDSPTASFSFAVMDENFDVTYDSPYDFKITHPDGSALFECSSSETRIYEWAMPQVEYPPLHITGQIDGEAFDATITVNEYSEEQFGHRSYNALMIVVSNDGSISLYEAPSLSGSAERKLLPNNA